MNKKEISKYEYALLILMGILCFSQVGSIVCQQLLHLPLSLPELFFVPLYLFLRPLFLPIKIDKNTLYSLTLLLIFLIVWSQLIGLYSIYAVLSSSRAYFYLFVFYSIYKKNTRYDERVIIALCLGSIIGWFFSSLFNFNTILSSGESSQDYGNMIAVSLFIINTIMLRRWRLFFAGFIMILGICIFSAVRRIVFVVLIAFGVAAMVQLLLNKKSPIKLFFMLTLVVIPLAYTIPKVGEYLEENSPVLYMRLFGKTEKMINGESDVSDDLRRDNIKNFFDSPEDFVIPKGMVSNQYYSDKGTGIYMDFPLFALAHIFGFPIAILIILFFFMKSAKCILLYRKGNNIETGVYGSMYIVFFSLLFVEGSFLVYPYIAPFTGMCLGRVIYLCKTGKYTPARLK